MKVVKGTCVALDSLAQFRVESEGEGKLVRMTVGLPYLEQEVSSRTKESVAAYNARICLVNTVLGKEVAYTDGGRLPVISDLTIDGRSVSDLLVQQGYLRLRKDSEPSEQLKLLEQEAKKKKVGIWGEEGSQLRNLPDLNESNLGPLVKKLQANKQSARLLVERVSGLKLFILCVDYDITAVIYFSELKIPRVGGLDSKTAWTHVQRYLNDACLNRLLEFEFKKEDVYKGEVSLYGNLKVNGHDIRNELLARGLAELSNTAKSFLSKEQFADAATFEQAARRDFRGLYGLGSKGDKFRERDEPEQPTTRNAPSSKQPNKFKQYETWIKEERRVNTLTRNPVDELNQIISYLAWDRKQELTDPRIKRMKIASQVFPVLMLNRTAKFIPQLKDYLKATCQLLVALSDRLTVRVEHTDSMKLLNLLLRGLIFCLNEIKQNQQLKRQEFFQVELEIVVKQVFKLTFVGNAVLHQKLFGKRNDLQFENFEFSALDYSGVSSMSEVSQSEDTIRPVKEDSKRRLQEAQLKVRVSASLLLALMLKIIPPLLELHWELCVRSNAFSDEFDEHIRQLQIKFSGQSLTPEQRTQVLNMMRVNFGEHSLLCMLIFEESSKVKLNILESIGLLATTFQGRKILPTLDVNLLEKEQKKTLSFVPKSLLVFRAYRNVLYTLLFCLYHEKNVGCVHALLKTVTLVIEHTALLQKLPFEQGLNILLGNYLLPMLSFPAENSEFGSLQLAVVNCLTAIISSEHEHKQLYNRWFDVECTGNINRQLMEVLKGRINRNETLSDQIVDTVNGYMAKLALNYLPALVQQNSQKQSIWKELSVLFKTVSSNSFGRVIEQLCRRTCPLKDDDEDQKGLEEEERVPDYQINFYKEFLDSYLPEWLEKHEEVETPQQLIDVLEVLTCLNNTTLEKVTYERVKKFLLFCFCRLSCEQPPEALLEGSSFKDRVMPRANEYRSNAIVKVAYVKLIGHMSFCETFHREDIMTIAYLNLRTILKESKGINTLVRCSWALSNWCNVETFLTGLTTEQLSETFSSLLDFARSDREKIASNGTRGIGMYIRNLPKATPLVRTDEVEKLMIANINHKSPKVSWNCSVALRNILKSPNRQVCVRLFQQRPFIESLLHNFSRSNYKLQIQTLETLKCLDPEQTKLHAESILRRVTEILEETLRHLTEYSFGEFKYINVLRRELIGYYIELLPELADDTVMQLTHSSLAMFVESIYQLLTDRTTGKEYSRNKELLDKGSESTKEVEKQIFNVKQTTKFHDELELPVKQSEYRTLVLPIDTTDHDFFEKLKRMSLRVVQLLEKSEAKVSLLVGDAFQQFSQMKLSEKSVELNLIELM